MEIYDLKDKIEYLDEVARLEYEEWADNKEENKEGREYNYPQASQGPDTQRICQQGPSV